MFEEGGDEISEEGLSVGGCAAEMAVFHASSCHLFLCALRSRGCSLVKEASGRFATVIVVAIEIIRSFGDERGK